MTGALELSYYDIIMVFLLLKKCKKCESKEISKYDSVIAKQPVENFLYTPSLLGNSCCKSVINNQYSYIMLSFI